MPTYLYKCAECGHRFEHVQGFRDDPLEVCPDCGGPTRRVIGNVGVAFKGSGFYRTDSRADKAKKPKKPAESAKSSSEGSSKDSKSAAPAKTDDGGKSSSGGGPAST